MNGALDMGNNRITGVLDPSPAQDASSKAYTDNIGALNVAKTGDAMSGSINMNLNKIINLGDPVSAQDIVTKNYASNINGIQTFCVVFGNTFRL